uniref:Uncharacterized protein n=1 Tax=Rhizophora mucronata TaxID=61149 RepID=A0A2P2PRL0_RHIMU
MCLKTHMRNQIMHMGYQEISLSLIFRQFIAKFRSIRIMGCLGMRSGFIWICLIVVLPLKSLNSFPF